jgi:hypothetical protein
MIASETKAVYVAEIHTDAASCAPGQHQTNIEEKKEGTS